MSDETNYKTGIVTIHFPPPARNPSLHLQEPGSDTYGTQREPSQEESGNDVELRSECESPDMCLLVY